MAKSKSPIERKKTELKWPRRLLALLGKRSDLEIARRAGISPHVVARERRRLGIAPFRYKPPRIIPRNREVAAIVRKPIDEACEILVIAARTVQTIRKELGISRPPRPDPWTKSALDRLGTVPDAEIAAELGIRVNRVVKKRLAIGRPPALLRPWTPEEDALLGTRPDAEIATKIKRTSKAVEQRRKRIGIPVPPRPTRWTKSVLDRLGTVPDAEIAAEIGLTVGVVGEKRRQLGRYLTDRFWTPEQDALLGTRPDAEIATKIGRSAEAVAQRRKQLGVPAPPRPTRWTKSVLDRLGTVPDAEIAAKIGLTVATVAYKRRQLGRYLNTERF